MPTRDVAAAPRYYPLERWHPDGEDAVTAPQPHPPIGVLLRAWRERRRLSQMELALDTEISTRHLSFIETGRSQPSREMILRLATQLDLPLRERNRLLLSAGFAPVHSETALDAPPMAAVHAAVRQVLTGHEPYPAVAVDRAWNLVDTNAGVSLLIGDVTPALLAPPANALRLSLHPDGMAPRIINLREWRAHLLGRLRRQITLTADPALADLYEELRTYPGGPERAAGTPEPDAIVVPLRLRHGDRELAFFSTVTTFGTPLDVTVSELAIESFFPADAETAVVLRDSRPRDANGSR